ncbi:MFS transporter [Coprothermobacter platensis]|uniref:MFS transporter n=1 Tax=Coprothermobacter platensis TaxID=108819 RepID=UPI001FDEFAE8|nr:MFS transporter [Coprothermobacter platensis]
MYAEKRYAILFAVLIGNLISSVDGSMINVLLPSISNNFSVPLSTVQWIPVIYLLVVSATLLLFGRIGDILGYRKPYLWGLAIFLISSLLAALSPNINGLIIARAIQGLGASMVMSVVLAMITAIFPSNELGKAMGLTTLFISVGLVMGPFLGGLLTSLISWRSAFYLDAAIALVGILLAFLYIPDFKGIIEKIDYVGAFYIFVAVSGLIFFISMFQQFRFNTLNLLVLIVSLIAFYLFLRQERTNSSPLIKIELFKSTSFSMGLLASSLAFISQFSLTFALPFHLQRLLNCPPYLIGIATAIFPLVSMVSGPISGTLSDHMSSNILAICGSAVCALGILTMAIIPQDSSFLLVLVALGIYGIGSGIFQSPNTKVVMSALPENALGIGSAVLTMARNIGMALGIAFASLLLYRAVSIPIMNKPSLVGTEALSFLKGLRYVYVFSAGSSLLSGLFALFSK